MSIANRLYDIPHGVEGTVGANPDAPQLYVDGQFPLAHAQVAYEGRIQIHNAIGNCTVQLTSGDLPPGYSISVDNTTQEVVVSWPAYTVNTTSLPNGNFSNGDTGWKKGAGWSIVQGDNVLDPDDPGNSWEGLFVHQIGESSMMSDAFIPIAGGQTITATIDVQTGGARDHSHGAAVRIGFYDVAGNKVGGGDGNVVKESTGDSWEKSSITITAPALAQYVNGGFASYRMHQDYALWVDNFKWDVTQEHQGVEFSETIPLSLEVTDSDERTADWAGVITVGPFAASGRYWRMYCTRRSNPELEGGMYLNLGLMALQAEPGGPNLCISVGGSATQSSELDSSHGAFPAFTNPNMDGTNNPNGLYWHTANQGPALDPGTNEIPATPWWAVWDFGAGKSQFVSQLTMTYTNTATRCPKDFLIQFSDDGTNWTTAATFTSVVPWGNNTLKSFSIG